MPQIKTLQEIVQERIARKADLLNNSAALIAEAHKHELRMALRFKSDPSLHLFIQQYVGGIIGALKVIPEQAHLLLMQNLMAQAITEWEDINREFEEQLKPNARP